MEYFYTGRMSDRSDSVSRTEGDIHIEPRTSCSRRRHRNESGRVYNSDGDTDLEDDLGESQTGNISLNFLHVFDSNLRGGSGGIDFGDSRAPSETSSVNDEGRDDETASRDADKADDILDGRHWKRTFRPKGAKAEEEMSKEAWLLRERLWSMRGRDHLKPVESEPLLTASVTSVNYSGGVSDTGEAVWCHLHTET